MQKKRVNAQFESEFMEQFSIDKIIEIFHNEFHFVENKFDIIRVLNNKKFNLENILSAIDKNDCIWHPGVYVFYGQKKVWKVGRHFINSRMRASQHLAENTQSENHSINDLVDIPDSELILFNLNQKSMHKEFEYHWVAAVEIYLENILNPLIRSKRMG